MLSVLVVEFTAASGEGWLRADPQIPADLQNLQNTSK
jgi:hypothetical protein